MQQQKIKQFLAHFVLDHVTIEYLKYGYQLTIEQLKLLIFILYFTENHKEELSLNMIIFYKNYQKNKLLKSITHLYEFNWISKKRHPYDQRRLVITLTQNQCSKITQLIEELEHFLEVKSTLINEINHSTLLSYYLKCHSQFRVIEKSCTPQHLTLEELYLLGLLIISDNKTTFKSIKVHSLKGIISLRPIIKTLQSKGYLIKSRSRDDERYIVLTLRKEKINVIQSEIEECYNKLEQGIQHV